MIQEKWGGYDYFLNICDEIMDTLKAMSFASIEEQGFMLLYKWGKLTDALHDVSSFRTDYQFIIKSQMKTIQKK